MVKNDRFKGAVKIRVACHFGGRDELERPMNGPARPRRAARRGRRGGPLRPTSSKVRAALFSILGPGAVKGLRVLDLYAGTGALGLEALDRGASGAVFVERDARRCAAIRDEAAKRGVGGKAQVVRGAVERAIERLEGIFDLVFVDPPYAEAPFREVFEKLEDRGSLAPEAVVFVEHDKRRALDSEYPGVRLQSVRTYGDTGVSIYRPARDEPESATTARDE